MAQALLGGLWGQGSLQPTAGTDRRSMGDPASRRWQQEVFRHYPGLDCDLNRPFPPKVLVLLFDNVGILDLMS